VKYKIGESVRIKHVPIDRAAGAAYDMYQKEYRGRVCKVTNIVPSGPGSKEPLYDTDVEGLAGHPFPVVFGEEDLESPFASSMCASYRCVKCGFEWLSRPRARDSDKGCPKCGSEATSCTLLDVSLREGYEAPPPASEWIVKCPVCGRVTLSGGFVGHLATYKDCARHFSTMEAMDWIVECKKRPFYPIYHCGTCSYEWMGFQPLPGFTSCPKCGKRGPILTDYAQRKSYEAPAGGPEKVDMGKGEVLGAPLDPDKNPWHWYPYYHCNKCGYEWLAPQRMDSMGCPKCGTKFPSYIGTFQRTGYAAPAGGAENPEVGKGEVLCAPSIPAAPFNHWLVKCPCCGEVERNDTFIEMHLDKSIDCRRWFKDRGVSVIDFIRECKKDRFYPVLRCGCGYEWLSREIMPTVKTKCPKCGESIRSKRTDPPMQIVGHTRRKGYEAPAGGPGNIEVGKGEVLGAPEPRTPLVSAQISYKELPDWAKKVIPQPPIEKRYRIAHVSFSCIKCGFDFLNTGVVSEGWMGVIWRWEECPKCGASKVPWKVTRSLSAREGYEAPLKVKATIYDQIVRYSDIFAKFPDAKLDLDVEYGQRTIKLRKSTSPLWLICAKCEESFRPPVCVCGSYKVRLVKRDTTRPFELVCLDCGFEFIGRHAPAQDMSPTYWKLSRGWTCPKCGSDRPVVVRLAQRKGYEAPKKWVMDIIPRYHIKCPTCGELFVDTGPVVRGEDYDSDFDWHIKRNPRCAEKFPTDKGYIQYVEESRKNPWYPTYHCNQCDFHWIEPMGVHYLGPFKCPKCGKGDSVEVGKWEQRKGYEAEDDPKTVTDLKSLPAWARKKWTELAEAMGLEDTRFSRATRYNVSLHCKSCDREWSSPSYVVHIFDAIQKDKVILGYTPNLIKFARCPSCKSAGRVMAFVEPKGYEAPRKEEELSYEELPDWARKKLSRGPGPFTPGDKDYWKLRHVRTECDKCGFSFLNTVLFKGQPVERDTKRPRSGVSMLPWRFDRCPKCGEADSLTVSRTELAKNLKRKGYEAPSDPDKIKSVHDLPDWAKVVASAVWPPFDDVEKKSPHGSRQLFSLQCPGCKRTWSTPVYFISAKDLFLNPLVRYNTCPVCRLVGENWEPTTAEGYEAGGAEEVGKGETDPKVGEWWVVTSGTGVSDAYYIDGLPNREGGPYFVLDEMRGNPETWPREYFTRRLPTYTEDTLPDWAKEQLKGQTDSENPFMGDKKELLKGCTYRGGPYQSMNCEHCNIEWLSPMIDVLLYNLAGVGGFIRDELCPKCGKPASMGNTVVFERKGYESPSKTDESVKYSKVEDLPDWFRSRKISTKGFVRAEGLNTVLICGRCGKKWSSPNVKVWWELERAGGGKSKYASMYAKYSLCPFCGGSTGYPGDTFNRREGYEAPSYKVGDIVRVKKGYFWRFPKTGRIVTEKGTGRPYVVEIAHKDGSKRVYSLRESEIIGLSDSSEDAEKVKDIEQAGLGFIRCGKCGFEWLTFPEEHGDNRYTCPKCGQILDAWDFEPVIEGAGFHREGYEADDSYWAKNNYTRVWPHDKVASDFLFTNFILECAACNKTWLARAAIPRGLPSKLVFKDINAVREVRCPFCGAGGSDIREKGEVRERKGYEAPFEASSRPWTWTPLSTIQQVPAWAWEGLGPISVDFIKKYFKRASLSRDLLRCPQCSFEWLTPTVWFEANKPGGGHMVNVVRKWSKCPKCGAEPRPIQTADGYLPATGFESPKSANPLGFIEERGCR
jgi:hypothetical protein